MNFVQKTMKENMRSTDPDEKEKYLNKEIFFRATSKLLSETEIEILLHWFLHSSCCTLLVMDLQYMNFGVYIMN